MPDNDDLREIGGQIEELLGRVRAAVTDRVFADVEALVRAVSDLYGAGLARVLELAARDAGVERAIVDDPLLIGLLVVHGLHPDSVEVRITRALEAVRPRLAPLEAEFVAVDDTTARVRLIGGASPLVPISAIVRTVEEAVLDVAPEVDRVEVDGPVRARVPVTVRPGRPPQRAVVP